MNRFPLTLALTLAPLAVAAQDTPELIVYTYDSFVSDWGPGPQIEANFEAICDCDLTFVGTGDGAAMVARLQLEGTTTDADIVLGLDTNLTAQAAATGLFADAPADVAAPQLPVEWDDPIFVPFDYSPFAFVYDTTIVETPPTSFEELAASDLKIVIQDPRSSTPGLGLLMWVDTLKGDDAGALWEALSDNIVTVTSGWSEAYGLFLEGEADMALSYVTSPAYHIIAEEDETKAAAIFEEGHYLQVEVAGALAGSDQPELAAEFLRFIATDGFQGVIPEAQWMFPAYPIDLPEGYAALNQPETSLLLSAEDAQARRADALAIWRDALSQ
ncbi:thiamine ABC transporter substrate binding subunit [Pontivivens insulae]|uniref:Thiamine-binding periplasmic protein n=1 Tax=Pontivivens insulae TaxID=1639689 RepID=A0A2R8ADB0_9RHOB|nr:thiamine ABC transporter substrate binding subunit [Pontivivens insulae]RED14115.1 thiamine transport system substrate-binding protein [Pontivivens insulae]SPF30189.1 Thiamine-binding periplasmic protein [Pontivivens insulae]